MSLRLFTGREPSTFTDLALLEDYTEERVRAFIAALVARGYTDVRPVETLRSEERQAWLYTIGRSIRLKDGRGWNAKTKRPVTVTGAATAERSWHRYRLAVDLFSPKVGWNDRHPFWRDMLAMAPDFSLRSGADWNANGLTTDERLVDWPHVQLRFGPTGIEIPRSPTAADIADLRADRLSAVYRRYGLRGDSSVAR